MSETNSGILEQIAQAVGVDLSSVTLVSVWVFCYFVAKKLLASGPRDDLGRQHLAQWAEKFGKCLTVFYEESVRSFLSLIDRWAGDEYLQSTNTVGPKQLRLFARPSPWSNGLYDLTLRVSLFYPTLFAVVGWAWSGQSVPGLETILLPETDRWRRGLVGVGTVAILVLAIRNWKKPDWRGQIFFFLVILVFFGLSGIRTGPLLVALAVYVAIGGSSYLAGTYVGTIASAFGVSFFLSMFVAVILIGDSTNSVFWEVSPFLYLIVSAIIFMAILFTIVLSMIIAVFVLRTRYQSGWAPTLFHLAHWIIFSGCAVAVFGLLPRSETNTGAHAGLTLMFLAVLPLANAPVDWVSLGVTRGLLRCGVEMGGTWRIGVVSVVDIVLAAALMIPLTAITAVAICVANWAAVSGGGEAVLPLAKILEALISSPYDPQFYWIYLMLFSTLLPSLVHVLGGLVGLVLACLLWVFESAKSAQEFAKDSRLEDVTKQTKLTTWYPAGAATGATALVAVVYIGGSAMPYVAAGVIWFAKLLFATALWTASFFPA